MIENNKVQTSDGQGRSITSLVLGILAIITSAVWYIGIILGTLAIIFGAACVKKRGHKKAVAGIVTGGIGVALSLLFVLIVQAALPALQKNQRDTARKNDLSQLTLDVANYQTTNQGKLPAASSLTVSGLVQIVFVVSDGQPTTDSAVYETGINCDGVASSRAYKVTVQLENGSPYCLGS